MGEFEDGGWGMGDGGWGMGVGDAGWGKLVGVEGSVTIAVRGAMFQPVSHYRSPGAMFQRR